MSSRNGCVNQKRATRNKAKKFVIKDGVLHYTALLSEEGKAAIPIGMIDKCWDLYHMECVGLERPPSNKSNGIVTIALYSHNNCMLYLFQTKPFDMEFRYTLVKG